MSNVTVNHHGVYYAKVRCEERPSSQMDVQRMDDRIRLRSWSGFRTDSLSIISSPDDAIEFAQAVIDIAQQIKRENA